jgi:hypothetical protein
MAPLPVTVYAYPTLYEFPNITRTLYLQSIAYVRGGRAKPLDRLAFDRNEAILKGVYHAGDFHTRYTFVFLALFEHSRSSDAPDEEQGEMSLKSPWFKGACLSAPLSLEL